MSESEQATFPEVDSTPVSFAEYRHFCDQQSTSFRRVGILDEESYRNAVTDTSTSLHLTESGVLPLLVPSGYVGGYDIDRCKKLTGKSNIFFLATPVEAITSPIDKIFSEDVDNSAVIIESALEVTPKSKKNLTDFFPTRGPEWYAHDFIDDRTTDPEHHSAWMAVYSGLLLPVEGKAGIGEFDNLTSAFQSLYGDLSPEDGHALYNYNDLLANPDIVDKLWGLFKDRFEWLGENHPVSMEDTREMFEGMLLSEDAYSSIRFVNGEPVCAGFFIHDIDNCAWLSTSFINKVKSLDQENGSVTQMYFPGIAAVLDNVGKYAEGLIKFHCELAARSGIRYRLLFESSNMSSTYIPRIVESYINNSGWLKSSDLVKLAQQEYFFLTQNK